MLDMQTLIVVSFISLFALVATTGLLWRFVSDEYGLRYFTFGSSAMLGGLFLLSLRGIVPDFFSIVLGNTLLISGLGYVFIGIRILMGTDSGPKWWRWLPAAVMFAGAVYFTYLQPDLSIRIVLFSMLCVFYMFGSAWAMWRYSDTKLIWFDRLSSLFFVAGGVINIVRATQAPTLELAPNFLLNTHWIIVLPYLHIIAFCIWLGMFLAVKMSLKLLRELKVALQHTEEANQELRILSVTDKLTGIYNRTKLDVVLHEEVQRAKRYGSTFSAIILDIDHFKDINDEYGHNTGDEVLVNIAKIVQDNVRSTDTVGRWGGEEFLFILPGLSGDQAFVVAEKIRRVIECTEFTMAIQTSASMGVASYEQNECEVSIIARTDKALYDAKRSGRNKTVLAV